MSTIRKSAQQRSVRLERVTAPSRSIAETPPGVTRRDFLAGAGVAAAAGAGAILTPAHGEAHFFQRCRPGAPRHIPGEDPALAGLGLHVFLPEPGKEPSTIYDFQGHVAILDLIGDCEDGGGNQLAFRADLRMMEGTYVGLDGTRHGHTFGFI
jgi:hypothetical protein